MPLLNEEIDFQKVAPAVQGAFIGRMAEKRLLAAGTKLYKHTSYSLFGNGGQISPWWSSVVPLSPADPGLAGSRTRAGNLGVTDVDFARARTAVTRQWNEMGRILQVRLTQPVYGFIGRCSGQRLDENISNVVLIGGAHQLWIPNLTLADVTEA